MEEPKKEIKFTLLYVVASVLLIIALGFLINRQIQRKKIPIKIPDKVIVLPEGYSNARFADIFAKTYPDFDKALFVNQASTSEGYLFPDTYFFSSSSTEVAIARLKKNFEDKTKTLKQEALDKHKDWNDVIVLATILEAESNNKTDHKIIAGILLKRLSIDMPLQVDSVPETYKFKGLPSRPVSNPGLDTISAVLDYTPTNYLYYLTGKDGLMHYAVTFEEHVNNKRKYLK